MGIDTMRYLFLLVFLTAVPVMGEDVTGSTLINSAEDYEKYSFRTSTWGVHQKEPDLYCKRHGKVEHGEMYLSGEIDGKKVNFCFDCVIELLGQNLEPLQERVEEREGK